MTRPTIKVAHISDTHLVPFKDAISEIGEVDVLIHSGDATFTGRYEELVPFFNELKEIASFVKHVIFVPGNHDKSFESKPHKVRKWVEEVGLPDNVHLLVERGIEIEGYKFYGHPHTPAFFDWAFNYERNSTIAKGIYNRIPEDTDVVITHGPPYGVLDLTYPRYEMVGCEVFLESLGRLKDLKLSCFGHIHESYGVTRFNDVLFSNASFMNERYDQFRPNSPHLYELSNSRAEYLDYNTNE